MRFVRKEDAGFTFIETIVVISIILILSAAVGFSAVRYIENARHVLAGSGKKGVYVVKGQ
jgi:prepilin-type N-terminal cleavage/methylation domain-containing protein